MCFVAIPALKSHGSLRNDSASVAFPSPGNPLAQEIMSLYQEPDGTRRLLNYLLDNLAGAIKRSKSRTPPVSVEIGTGIANCFYISIYRLGHCEPVYFVLTLLRLL